jgi:DnaJ-class molecular chaperone
MPRLQSHAKGDLHVHLEVEVPTKLNAEQRKAFVQQKTEERAAIQKEMARLETERRKYIEAENAQITQAKPDDFGTAVATSMRNNAKTLGFD